MARARRAHNAAGSACHRRPACYDKTAPLAESAKPAAAAKVPASKVDSAEYVDKISAEDVLMNAKLKNICRGC
jgi:hypothetical protein